jgi:hypothetical protein
MLVLVSSLYFGLLLSGFPIKILHTFLFSQIRTTCLANLILFDFIILVVHNNNYICFDKA